MKDEWSYPMRTSIRFYAFFYVEIYLLFVFENNRHTGVGQSPLVLVKCKNV